MKKNKDTNLGILSLLGAAASWGTMGVLVRFLNKEITPFSQVLFRYIVALGLSSLPLVLKKRKLNLASKKDYLLMLFVGIFGYGITNIFYTLAMINTTISAALFIFSLYAVITPIFAIVFLKEKLSRKLIFSVLIAILGGLFIFNPTGLLQNFKGNIYALIACILTSFYYVGVRALSKKNNSELITSWSIFLGVLILLPLSFIFERPLALKISPISWLFVFLFALANFTAYYLCNIGFSKIKASIGSIVLLMEPVFGTVFALLIFFEIPGISIIIGAVLIILSVVYLNLGKFKT